nr:hypothetical protein BaRGS_020009 [Batillaria attramentaria]
MSDAAAEVSVKNSVMTRINEHKLVLSSDVRPQKIAVSGMRLTKKVFPRAIIRASSIIPTYGNHPDNKAIHPSNKHLKTACDKEKTPFIDNTPSFVTKQGAPKQAHYWDTYHPSDEGTAKLAVNLKYAGRISEGNDQTAERGTATVVGHSYLDREHPTAMKDCCA